MRFRDTLFFIIFFTSCHVFAANSLHFPTEKSLLTYIRDTLLPEDPVILEAGGHYGEHTKIMKTVWPQSTMYVFEPLKSSFEKLLERAYDLKNVYCYNYALSDHTGIVNFHVNPGNSGASSIGAPVPVLEERRLLLTPFDEIPIPVNCVTIAEWTAHHKVNGIDFMWLDMEGHELQALMHAGDILDKVKVIYTEINFIEIRKGSCLYVDIKKYLEEKGFREVWKKITTPRSQGDALFVR